MGWDGMSGFGMEVGMSEDLFWLGDIVGIFWGLVTREGG